MPATVHRGRGRRTINEINMVPFIDVMLVLLIIFMVTAPLLTAGVPLDLPQAKGKTIEAPNKEPVVVSITQDGKIFIGQEEKNNLSLDELVPKLKAIFDARGTKDEAIFLRGAKQAQHGVVTQVLARIKASGFQKVSIVTESESGG